VVIQTKFSGAGNNSGLTWRNGQRVARDCYSTTALAFNRLGFGTTQTFDKK
jgi:hypothetical protein